MSIVACTSSREALDLLRFCMGEGGKIVQGFHFRDKMELESIEVDDAYAVMRSGAIYEPPECDIKTGEQKWRVEGWEPDGKWLAIVFSFKAIDCAFLITVYSVESRNKK